MLVAVGLSSVTVNSTVYVPVPIELKSTVGLEPVVVVTVALDASFITQLKEVYGGVPPVVPFVASRALKLHVCTVFPVGQEPVALKSALSGVITIIS